MTRVFILFACAFLLRLELYMACAYLHQEHGDIASSCSLAQLSRRFIHGMRINTFHRHVMRSRSRRKSQAAPSAQQSHIAQV
jgi:hypothetical protein